MNYGAEPADQVVRYSLEGMEYSLKITGNVAKHVAVFIAAALKDQKKTRGKTRLTRMLKEQRPMKFFTVPGDRLKEFAKEAKARGILYVVIKDKVNPDQTEVMVFADDAAKMNRVLDRMNLDFVKAESGSMVTEAVEKETTCTNSPPSSVTSLKCRKPDGKKNRGECTDRDCCPAGRQDRI